MVLTTARDCKVLASFVQCIRKRYNKIMGMIMMYLVPEFKMAIKDRKQKQNNLTNHLHRRWRNWLSLGTRPDTRQPKSRAGGQGKKGKFAHLGRSSSGEDAGVMDRSTNIAG